MNASDRAERTAIAFYGATVLVIELLLVAAVRHVASQPDLLIEPSEAETLPVETRTRAPRVVQDPGLSRGDRFGIVAFPKAAAIVYLVVAAEGVLLLGGNGRFSLRRLLQSRLI